MQVKFSDLGKFNKIYKLEPTLLSKRKYFLVGVSLSNKYPGLPYTYYSDTSLTVSLNSNSIMFSDKAEAEAYCEYLNGE